MANQEVRAPEGQFDYLDDEFTSRLRKYVSTESTAVPLARPPCAVGLIMLEFAREEHRNQYFVNGTLNRYNRDETKDSMRCVPKLEKPLDWSK